MRTIQLPDGATVDFLTPVAEGAPCVMRGTIPAGGVVPLHSHGDPKTFILLSGAMEGYGDDGWALYAAGDVRHIAGDEPHAWRNSSPEPAVSCIASTAAIGRFFHEVASSPEEFLAISARYGYWNATPEENAAIGLTIPAPALP